MSIKASLARVAIRWTPKAIILWVANRKLHGIARLTDFSLDLDTRRLYVKTSLAGEAEPIEVLIEDFAIVGGPSAPALLIQRAQSNRTWLNNAFLLMTKRPWAIPSIPQLAPHMGLVAELFAPRQT